jgi:hypothetical protein
MLFDVRQRGNTGDRSSLKRLSWKLAHKPHPRFNMRISAYPELRAMTVTVPTEYKKVGEVVHLSHLLRRTCYAWMRLFQRVSPIFDGSSVKISKTIIPTIGMSPSQTHQPLRSMSCRRRMNTDKPGKNRARAAIV